ncbi:hypothetical protein IWW48_002644 [Coemansia sp. RSA 1200]|nr:hypothetical protein IWW48_002644 [Coemansia sp. RSA 1200]
MSGFADLVGNGADCGPGNGVNGLMKQLDKDHSLEQASILARYSMLGTDVREYDLQPKHSADRFGPSQASTSRHAFRQTFRQNGPTSSPSGTANGFMTQAARVQGPQSFNFAEMHRELNGVQARLQAAPHADWSADFAKHQTATAPGAATADFERAFMHATPPGPAQMNLTGPMHMYRPSVAGPMASRQANWAEQFHQTGHLAASASQVSAPETAAASSDPMAMAFNEARMYSMPHHGPAMMMNMNPMANPMMAAHRPMVYPQQVGENTRQKEYGAAEQSVLQDGSHHDDSLAQTAAQILESVSGSANPKLKDSAFFSFMQQVADGQATISGDQVVSSGKGKQVELDSATAQTADGPTWATEFEKRADELVDREAATKSESQIPHTGKMFSEELAHGLERNWAEEFEQTLDGPLRESVVSGHPQELDVKLEQPSSDFIHGEADKGWLEQFKDNIEPMLNEQDREWLDTQKEWETLNTLEASHRAVDPELNIYRFQPNNYYEGLSTNALQETIQQIRQNSEAVSLGDSILALESAVSQNPKDARAWLELGLKQQENEQEQAAIAALRKAISLDPDALDAHLALAVSYTNEGYQMDAYDELHEWIAHHDRYKSLVPSSAAESMTSSETRKNYVQDLYIKAARMLPGQDWDSDVQVALGVLFNISSEYDKAVDCFKAALSKRPDDYILWNRLGATEAHTGNNKEATQAYFRALELHPSFIRARYNMSLASTNMGQHREAAENCLIALSLQQRELQTMDEKGKAANVSDTTAARGLPGSSGMSATIWNALQLSMYMLGEPKLAEACERQDLDAFRSKFDF